MHASTVWGLKSYWLAFVLGLVATLLVVWAFSPVLTHDYGWNDDYQLLKRVAERSYHWRANESMESGRPLAGWAVSVIFRIPQSINGLAQMRGVSVAAAVVFMILAYVVLLANGFDVVLAFAASLLMVMTPAFGVYAGWLTTGPDPLAAGAALTGGALITAGMEAERIWLKIPSFLLAGILLFSSCCFYQPVAPFAEVAVFMRLLSPLKRERPAFKMFLISTIIVAGVLAAYFIVFKVCAFVYGWQGEAQRAAISSHLLQNLRFVSTRLAWSALTGWAQFHTRGLEITAATVTLLVMIAGAYTRVTLPGATRLQIVFGLLVTCLFSVLPQLFLAEQLFAFRTQAVLLAVSGLTLAYSVDKCVRAMELHRCARWIALGIVVALVAITTHIDLLQNFVLPCVREREALTAGLKDLKTFPDKLAFVPPPLWNREIPDFGEYRAPSSSCCWIATPMLELLLIETYDPDISLKKAVRRHPLFEVQYGTIKNNNLPVVDGFKLVSGEYSSAFNDSFWGSIRTNRSGWMVSPWFGVFNSRDFPRVYHSQLGWLLCQPHTSGDYEFISDQFGAFHTSADTYPELRFQNPDRRLQLIPTIQWPACIFRDPSTGVISFEP